MSEECGREEGELVCAPIDTLDEMFEFVKSPPAWRSLCTGLQPHSEYLVRNMEVDRGEGGGVVLERPRAFCHLQPPGGGAEDETAPAARLEQSQLPKTLVCHDMANGYHDDSKIEGSSAHDAYTFYNWAGVDVFCYFSHHLVTVPPLAWINVAHKHGVKVIGTVITEWAEGTEFWRRVLETDDSARDTASALVAIARALRFEGWLLNVENKVSSPDKLVQFVRLLHRALHAELGAAATLIWYDSVTVEGHLNWQNKLNDKNRAFFDACDGLFTNYSWTEEDVRVSAAAAGARRTDLFVGVDVWGRNFHGGGQFNTQEAVRLVHSHGCSMAIFAPAWTHEAMAPAGEGGASDANAILLSGPLGQYECFLLRDRALWDSLWPFLNTRVPCALPFQTAFCRGQGSKRRVYGEVFSPGPWYNLRHQQYQPNAAHGPHGYLLAPRRALLASTSHLAAATAPDGGILKLRESLYQLHRSQSLAGSPSLARKTVSMDEVVEEHGGAAAADGAESAADRPSLKHKIQDALLKCCSKITKTDALAEEPEKEAETSGPPPAAEAGGAEPAESVVELGARRSMLQVSVSLRLGQSAGGGARPVLVRVAGERACLEQHHADSFSGGSCLCVHPSDAAATAPGPRTARLLFSDFRCEHALVACVVTKQVVGHEGQFLDVLLTGTDSEEVGREVTLLGRDVPADGATCVSPVRAGQPAFQRLQRYLLLHEPGFYVPVENVFGWDVRYYEVPCAGMRVTEVRVRAGLPRGPALLGHFGLCARADTPAAHLAQPAVE